MPIDDPGALSADDTTVELLAKARSGDRGALEQLFARHIPLLRRWASGRLPRWARDIADTPDLVQETALQSFKHLETFEPRGDGALQAYLRQALINRVRDEVRRLSRYPAAATLEESDRFADPAASPLERGMPRTPGPGRGRIHH